MLSSIQKPWVCGDGGWGRKGSYPLLGHLQLTTQGYEGMNGWLVGGGGTWRGSDSLMSLLTHEYVVTWRGSYPLLGHL